MRFATRRGNPKIIVDRAAPFAVEVFSQIGTVIPLNSNEIDRHAAQEADIIIVRSQTKVDKLLLEGSNVRFVGTLTIGTDHLDTDYLSAKDIGFANAPGSNSDSVAEYVAAALLAWASRANKSLEGKTLGIVGVGNIGRKVVEVARALGMVPLLNDPPLARRHIGGPYVSLSALMEADFISLHVPLTYDGEDRTFHLFNEQVIGRMKRGSVLINTARGGVVETRALRNALEASHLSAAIIDVWENEPLIDTKLLKNVMLGTPHIAGYSHDGRLRALSMVYQAVCKHLNVRPTWSMNTEIRETTRIVIPEHLVTNEEIISYAIHEAYDIEQDDSLLRAATLLPDGLLGEYFTKLRTEYRMRKEFFHFSVGLGTSQKATKSALQRLRFSV
jgi:erythronate-4-phosphate dehydrogenase